MAVVDVAGSPLLDALVFELCAEHHHGSPLRPPAPLRARADQDLLRAVAVGLFRGARQGIPYTLYRGFGTSRLVWATDGGPLRS